MTVLDPTTAGEDAYVTEDDSTTVTGKFYQVVVPGWGNFDPKNTPEAVTQSVNPDEQNPTPDLTWPPFAYWYGAKPMQGAGMDGTGVGRMSSYIRLGATANSADGWTLDSDPSKAPTPPGDDTDGLLTGAAVLNVLEAERIPDFINYCGHREHTDGNRIVTTYGHHINVVNGDYHNVALAHVKWAHGETSWMAPGLDPTAEQEDLDQGVANHYLCCDVYYDVMSTWYFPDTTKSDGNSSGHFGEKPIPFDQGFIQGNKGDAKGETYDSNGNLIGDYYEYINAQNLRETVCADTSHAEKTFAKKHVYMVCTRYDDHDHTHSENVDFKDWSDGELWERYCTKSFYGETTATGDIEEYSHAGGDVKETVKADGNISSEERATSGTISETTVANIITSYEEAIAINEHTMAKAAIDSLTIAGAEISELTITGGANLDAKITGGANVDVSTSVIGLDVKAGAALIDLAAGIAVAEVTAAIAALIEISVAPIHIELAAGLLKIDKANEKIDLTVSKKEFNAKAAVIALEHHQLCVATNHVGMAQNQLYQLISFQ